MYTSIDARWDYDIYDPFDMPTKLTELFISYGADVDAKDNCGRTALMWACSYRGYYYMFDVDEDKSPIIPAGVGSGNLDYYNMTKLTPVFYYGQIKALVDAGADVYARNNKGFTALDYLEFAMDLNARKEDEKDVAFYKSKAYLDSCEEIRQLLR
jgi:ankyrin repeat protein